MFNKKAVVGANVMPLSKYMVSLLLNFDSFFVFKPHSPFRVSVADMLGVSIVQSSEFAIVGLLYYCMN